MVAILPSHMEGKLLYLWIFQFIAKPRNQIKAKSA